MCRSLLSVCICLSVSLYLCLSACLSPSLSLTGNHNNTVFILRLTAQSSDTTSQPLGLRTVHYRKKPPGQVFRDKRKAEERIAAMKHQQPQTSNSQQQGHKQASEFQENYVDFFCLLLTKIVNKAKQREFTIHVNKTRTQRVHNTRQQN